jgi:bifunctional non-homologous end joining protein LigD
LFRAHILTDRLTMAIRKKTAAKARAKTAPKTPKAKPAAAKKSAPISASTPSAAAQLKEYQRKRDFEKTTEPSGPTTTRYRAPSHTSSKSPRPPRSPRDPAVARLRFVIQKHAATNLHYDLRLEIDGVMKSWAVPKGPSSDPTVKRLAMQVEDHPLDYNTFEGTIPAGEYGGGTVMLWDTGTYEIENPPDDNDNDDDDDPNPPARDAYDRGELKVIFHGKRVKGSYALVRTRGMRGNSAKPSWLLIKHRDTQAHPESDSILTEKFTNSVTTGRTMDEISGGTRSRRP